MNWSSPLNLLISLIVFLIVIAVLLRLLHVIAWPAF